MYKNVRQERNNVRRQTGLTFLGVQTKRVNI